MQKRIKNEIREYLAWKLLGWALHIMPLSEFQIKLAALIAVHLADYLKKPNEEPLTTNKETLRSKDPADYKLDALSTDWQAENHYCTKCLQTTSHNEYMAEICNGCGSFGTQKRYQRTWRKIFVDGKWRYQVRYIDGKEEIRDQWY